MNRRALLLSGLIVALAGPALGQDRRRRLSERRRDDGDGEGVSDAPRVTVVYGPHPKQAFDVYDDAGAAGPVLVFVHGGGWSRGDKAMVHDLPDYARRHGLTLVSINYRLVPEVTAREQAQDLAAAIARVRQDRPSRPIVLLGHSAGAHLTALVGVDPRYLGEHGLTPSDLAGVVTLDSAAYDATLPRPAGPAGRYLERLYDDAFGDQRADLSPTLRVRSGVRYPPLLIFHVVSREDSATQSRGLAQALIAVGGRAETVAASGDSHAEINGEFGQAGDAEGERAARFIASLR